MTACMHSSIPRDADYVRKLLTFLQREYPIVPRSLTPAERGHYGETWRCESDSGPYFAKLDATPHQVIYARSFPLMERLVREGIDTISKPVKTHRGELFTRFDSAVLGVFEWIDGERIETDETKIPEYAMLAKIYTINPDGLNLPRETFTTESADLFFRTRAALKDRRIADVFERSRTALNHRAQRLAHFAERCRADHTHFYITHGDAGGNIIVHQGRHHLVDWDEALIAPPERDAWVMCCREWARNAFARALCQAGIRYDLRSERLAYYIYHMFFSYLNAFLDGFTKIDPAQEIAEYLDGGWITERTAYADNLR